MQCYSINHAIWALLLQILFITYKTTYSQVGPLRDIVIAELKPREITGEILDYF